MVKEMLVVMGLLLAGCGPAGAPDRRPTGTVNPTLTLVPTATATITTTPTAVRTPVPRHVFRDDDPAAIRAFKTGADCPNICWLGIHVGTMSETQAFTAIMNSKGVEIIEVSDRRIQAGRNLEHMPGELYFLVTLEFSGSIVSSMVLQTDLSLGDLMSFIGEPAEVEMGYRSDYILSYPTLSTVAYANGSGYDSPSPGDPAGMITVNVPPDESKYFQPWLGYGYGQDYSRNPMPRPTEYP